MSLSVPSKPLFEVISQAACRGGQLTILGPNGPESRSYGSLVEEADVWAAGLAVQGFGVGDRVGLFARSSFHFVVGLLAVWRCGATAVPLPLRLVGRSRSKALDPIEVLQRLKASGVLVTEGDRLDGSSSPSMRVVSADALGSDGNLSYSGPALDDTALIQLSSGSTGRPRAVALTHGAIAAYVEATRDRFGPWVSTRERNAVSWLPLYHDLGLINYLTWPLATGICLSLIPTGQFLADPSLWLHELDRVRGTDSAAPNFGYGLMARWLENNDPGHLDLSSWTRAGVGGEPVRRGTLERFVRATSEFGFEAIALTPGYGLAEATCAVTSGEPSEAVRVERIRRDALSRDRATVSPGPDDAAEFVSCGTPFAGARLSIRDENGLAVTERSIGEIWVTSPSLMVGYVDDPIETNRVLQDGWLRTGDRGYLADGQLFITGRIKDMIIIKGLNYYAEDIEGVAQEVDGVRKGGCVAFGREQPSGDEGVVLLVEASSGSSGDPGPLALTLKRVLWRELRVPILEVKVLAPGTLPKTSSGKLRRRAAKTMYEGDAAELGGGSLVPR
jgi:fatty-acyl-CoA synthase